jgi:tetratricopeptide (TPR) repeat protein
MKPLEIPDLHHLRAAIGWLELGNHIEANAELENIDPKSRSHPDVLEIHYEIYAKDHKWDACREIAAALLKQAPERPTGWLHLSYSTRRATGGGLQAAFEVLSPAATRFPNLPTISYNLACYTCQLGQLKEAWNWLEKAFDVANDPRPIKTMAASDGTLHSSNQLVDLPVAFRCHQRKAPNFAIRKCLRHPPKHSNET